MNIVCNYDLLKEKLLTYGYPLDKIDEELNSLKRSGKHRKTKHIRMHYNRIGEYKSLDVHNMTTGGTLVIIGKIILNSLRSYFKMLERLKFYIVHLHILYIRVSI